MQWLYKKQVAYLKSGLTQLAQIKLCQLERLTIFRFSILYAEVKNKIHLLNWLQKSELKIHLDFYNEKH